MFVRKTTVSPRFQCDVNVVAVFRVRVCGQRGRWRGASIFDPFIGRSVKRVFLPVAETLCFDCILNVCVHVLIILGLATAQWRNTKGFKRVYRHRRNVYGYYYYCRRHHPSKHYASYYYDYYHRV